MKIVVLAGGRRCSELCEKIVEESLRARKAERK